MAFTDLPDNWSELPLEEPALVADVLDLFVSMRDRMRGCLVILICDAHRRILQAVVIEEIEMSPPPDSVDMVRSVFATVGAAKPDATVLVALGRPGGLRVHLADERWADCVRAAGADTLEIIGVHLVTPRGSMPIAAGSKAA